MRVSIIREASRSVKRFEKILFSNLPHAHNIPIMHEQRTVSSYTALVAFTHKTEERPATANRYLHSAQPLPNSSSFSSPGSTARAWSRRLFTPMKNWRIITTSR